jgi:hypothetical protein
MGEVVLEVASSVAPLLLLTQELLEQVVSSLSLSFLRDREVYPAPKFKTKQSN